MSNLKQESMNFSNGQLISAFKGWLQAQEFYTGEDGDKELSNWDKYLLIAGSFAVTTTVRVLTKSEAPTSTDVSSAKDAEKAEPELAKLRNEFDFVGFKTKWSTPRLILGLLADSLSVSEIKTILSRIPQQVGPPLKKYGHNGNGSFGIGGSLQAEVLLVYMDSEVCRQHSMQVLPDATSVNKPLGTVVRAWCIDINKQTLEISPPTKTAKFFDLNKNSKNDPKEVFKKNKLDGVIAFLRDKSK